MKLLSSAPLNILQKYKIGTLVLLLFVFSWGLFGATPAYAQPSKRVLLLNAYSYDLAWTASITKGVEEAIAAQGDSVKLSVEFMDTKNYFSSDYLSMLVEQYRFKYGSVYFDAIITSDDNAANFALKYRDELFNSAPIIFCGVNNHTLPDSPEFKNITGVLESADGASTLKAALLNDPQLTSLYVIIDESTSGKSMRLNLEESLAPFAGQVNLIWLQGLSMTELKETLSTLPQHTAVMLVTFTRDRLGNSFTFAEALAHMYSVCERPIYSLFDFYMGDGIVGGMITSGQYQGEIAADLALQVVGGKKPESIPVVYQKANRYMFDYTEMTRFGFSLDSLPPESIVINIPESMYEKYTYEIWSVCGAFILLSFIIILLLINNSTRRKAEKDLEEVNRYQETLVEQRTEELTQRSRELEMANYELKKLDKLKTAVLNTVSHDLRTPLTSVLGFCKIIDRDFNKFFVPLCHEVADLEKRGGRIQDNLSIIEKEGGRLTRLINDFLDLSKIESGDIAWNDVSVSPGKLLEQAAPVLEGYFSDTGVKLTVKTDDNLPNIVADPDRLLQVLNNLIGNAAKFTYHGEVTLTATATEGGWLKVVVSDTGVGIPQEELAHIFDKFYQIAQSTTDTDISRGSGMGLAISKRIIEHYNGTITAESAPNQGSSFIFTIPDAE